MRIDVRRIKMRPKFLPLPEIFHFPLFLKDLLFLLHVLMWLAGSSESEKQANTVGGIDQNGPPQGKPVPLIDGVAISLAQGWSARRLSLSAPALFVREVA